MKRRQFLKAGALGVAGTACAASGAAGQAETPERAGAKKEVPRIPRLVEPWWRACHSPELPEIASPPGQVVDHCFFKAENGLWQLWTQIRGTAAGRLFYRWEAERGFEQPDWTPRGICWRADREAGESWDTGDEEFVHAPYVMREQGRFVMYFGGGPSKDGDAQISIATSKNGIAFTRAVNADGQSAACIGPGYARDAMVLKIEDRYCMYYAADVQGAGVIAMRASPRPFGADWTEYREVSRGGICGNGRTSQQCPYVLFLDGFYYLFKMGPSDRYETAVYRSRDPFSFGTDDRNLVTVLKASAAEIIRFGGDCYLSSLIPGYKGVRISRLDWEAAS